MSVEPVSRRDQGRAAKPPPRPPGVPGKANWTRRALVALLLVTVAVSVALRAQPGPPEPVNLASQYNDLLPLDRLQSVGDPGWVGILAAGSTPGAGELQRACAAFTERLQMQEGQTVRILTVEGGEFHACGEAPPRR